MKWFLSLLVSQSIGLSLTACIVQADDSSGPPKQAGGERAVLADGRLISRPSEDSPYSFQDGTPVPPEIADSRFFLGKPSHDHEIQSRLRAFGSKHTKAHKQYRLKSFLGTIEGVAISVSGYGLLCCLNKAHIPVGENKFVYRSTVANLHAIDPDSLAIKKNKEVTSVVCRSPGGRPFVLSIESTTANPFDPNPANVRHSNKPSDAMYFSFAAESDALEFITDLKELLRHFAPGPVTYGQHGANPDRVALHESAARGHAEAMVALGYYYDQSGDPEQCLAWMNKAASAGDPLAQNFLAQKFYDGDGVPKDYAQAADWFGKAADQGFDTARNMLGLLYWEGKGVAQNIAEAKRWMSADGPTFSFDRYDTWTFATAQERTMSPQRTHFAEWAEGKSRRIEKRTASRVDAKRKLAEEQAAIEEQVATANRPADHEQPAGSSGTGRTSLLYAFLLVPVLFVVIAGVAYAWLGRAGDAADPTPRGKALHRNGILYVALAGVVAIGGLLILLLPSTDSREHAEAGQAFANGDFDGSIRLYTQAIKTDPADARAYSERALAKLLLAESMFWSGEFGANPSTAPGSRGAKMEQALLGSARNDIAAALKLDPADQLARALRDSQGPNPAASDASSYSDPLAKEVCALRYVEEARFFSSARAIKALKEDVKATLINEAGRPLADEEVSSQVEEKSDDAILSSIDELSQTDRSFLSTYVRAALLINKRDVEPARRAQVLNDLRQAAPQSVLTHLLIALTTQPDGKREILESLDTAIRLRPEGYWLFELRGLIHNELGIDERADKDEQEAKRLKERYGAA